MDIIGIENPVMDFNILVDKMPDNTGFGSMTDYSWQGGGNVGSAMVAAARLGAKCGMVGFVGEDKYGQFCLNDLNRHNIDTSHIIRDRGVNTTLVICFAEISTMKRSFIGKLGTQRQPTEIELDEDYISTTKYIHVGAMHKPQVQAAVWAKERGIQVVIDAGGFNSDTDAHINLIDIFIGSEYS